MRNKQRGMGLLGMFFVAMILVFTSMLVMTVVPSYIEYFSIKKVLDTMVADPQMQDAKISQIRESYTRRSGIDNITSVKAADLEISRDNGKLTLSAEYHVEKSLFANIGIYIDFAPTTAANGAP
jgi:hypothetical protein